MKKMNNSKFLKVTHRMVATTRVLSMLNEDQLENPTDNVLLLTDRLEDMCIEVLRLTGRLDILLKDSGV